MLRPPDTAILWYELGSYFRRGFPFRFILLLPAGIFLAAWLWRISSPLAAAVWLAFLALEPRLNNIFYGSPRELEALALLPADWRRIVLLKNLSTLLAGSVSAAVFSVVMLWFSPDLPSAGGVADAALYAATVIFPVLSLGNEASLRYPGRDAGIFSRGLSEAIWMSLTLLVVSVPYSVITGLIGLEWLCIPYAAATALVWYFRSVPRTAAQVMDRKNEIWTKRETSSSF